MSDDRRTIGDADGHGDGGAPARRRDVSDRLGLVDVFVAAFEHDPWFQWRYPIDYPARAHEWFNLVTELVWERAEAWLTPGGEAGAIWIPPGVELAGPDDLAAVGRLIGRQHGERAAEIAAALGAAVEFEPAVRHALCLYVGVRPEDRGRGLGGLVMRPRLELCDRDGEAAYLNSTNPRNVSFYDRLGFRTVGVTEVAPGIVFRSMLRPAPGGGKAL